MTIACAFGLIAIAIMLVLITTTQMLYLESQRLRARDLAMQQFFRSTLEGRFGLSIEIGSLAFSIAKHGLVLVMGGLALALAWDDTGPTLWGILQMGFSTWLLMIVVAYVLPQFLYRRTSGHWLTPFVPVLKMVSAGMRPVIAVLGFLHSIVDLANESTPKEDEPSSAENIDALITAGAEEGLIEEEDRRLIQNVVEFGDKVVREVMTARPDIVAIRAEATLEELRNLVIHEQYSRIPVYESNIDNILGFVHVRDMFELDESERASRRIASLMRPIRVVPETKPVHDLMREMQQEGAHMVIVVDEYGNTAGLATMEDLVEVILGEIRDEHEPDADARQEASGAYIVSGSFDVDRLGDILNIELEEVESTTIGGLVSEWLGRVPAVGESVEREGVRLEVLASDELRVEQVRVSRVEVGAHE